MNATIPPFYRSSSAVRTYRSHRSRGRVAAAGAALAVLTSLALGGSGLHSVLVRPALAQGTDAQRTGSTAPSTIAVLGEGTARVKPDAITLRLGVEVNAQNPTSALSRTREASERVLQRLRELGVAEGDLQTTGFNVFRIQDGPPPGASQAAPTSYRGYAGVSAKVADVAKAGTLLEAAMQAGATAVEGLGYGLRDDSQLRLVAIADAVRAARPRAEAAAAAAGLRLGGVRSVAELDASSPVRPAMGGGTGEGVAPGEIEVIVRVNVTFDVL